MAPYFSYWRATTALAVVFAIPPPRRGPFLARIKHLQSCGLRGTHTPVARRTEYPYDGILQWLFALALMQAHTDPSVAVRTVQANWRRAPGPTVPHTPLSDIAERARAAGDGADGLFLLLRMQALPDGQEPIELLQPIGVFQPLERTRQGRQRENWKLLFSELDGAAARTVIPLSYLVRRLDQALAAPKEVLEAGTLP